jgi:hypothetical protein
VVFVCIDNCIEWDFAEGSVWAIGPC